MRIQDAKPGDVLRDKDGDLWLRGDTAAWAVCEGGVAGDPYRWGLESAEIHGPFTLVLSLVPEPPHAP